MALLSRLFPASRSDRSASRIPGRRRSKARSHVAPVAARALSLVAEPLEPRAMLAVTATLVGGDLVIAYNEPGDLMADIESDGTIYTVTGTGLAATKFNVVDVTGVITVRDDAVIFGQQFQVLAGTALANPLQVNSNVESATLNGGINATRAGNVLIGSAVIMLANDISTAATNANVEFANPVTLAKNTTINAGAGAITFKGTVDGKFTLAANSTGATTFGGVVGGITPLVSLATNPGGTASLWSVTTTGTQTYGDGTVTLNGTYTTNDATFTVSKNTTLAGNTVVSTGTGDLAFSGTVDGAYRLTVADANDVYFSGKVGSNDPLAGITLQKATSVSSEDTISLDGTPALAASGITIDAGVNKVSLTKAGSTIQNFSANGVWFKGGSTDSTISGFTIKANGGDGVRLDAGGYSGTTISENLIHDNDGNGVRLTAATGPVSIADNLKIDLNGLNGVYASSSTNVTISGNSIDQNVSHGILVEGGSGVIDDNEITDNGGTGVMLAGGYDVTSNNVSSNLIDGVQVAAGLTDLPIASNWIYDNGRNGIYFTGGVTGFSVFRNDIGQAPDNTPAGNGASGVRFDAGTYTGTLLFDNKETTGVEGGAIAYNTLDGIFLNAASTPGGAITGLTIGGTTDDGNSIHGNGANGILVSAGDYTGTVIQGNEIDDNTADGIHLAGSAGLISLGRLVITAPGLTGTPLTTSAAAELFLPGVTSSSIQAIDAAGYPGASLGFVSLDASVAGTPPTTVSGAGGIGGISDPGLAYQAAAQTAFETNPLLPGTNGRAGTAAYDAASSGTLPNGGGQDGFMFYDFLVSGGAGVLNLLIVDNLVASNGSDGIEAAVGDHMGTAITGNELRGNGNPATHVGNGILVEGSNLTIGWAAEAGEPNTVGNTITGNAANGIEIRGAAAQNNTILSNSIYLNGYAASGVVVGDGIALVDGGNGALPSPRILGAVADKGSGTVRVQVVVPAAGSYYVQLFANTAADERGLVPVDVKGFEGRTYVGDSPAQAGSTVTNVKPLIAGVLIAGNTVNVIEMPAARVPAGSWITATATKVDSTTLSALNTSSFSEAVQLPSASVLAVGSDGPAVWVPHYNYQALSGNVLRLGGLTVTEVNRLVAMRGRQIFISANGRSEVATATVANVQRIGGRAVNMVLRNITSPEGSLAGTVGRLEPGPLTLPTARLYDAATGEVVLDVGAEAIAASLQAAGVAPAAADAFVSRFQGGLRVASGDVDGDGFADLMTAPGAAPAIPAATFGNATRIITIYSGNEAAAWESVSLDVSAAFPGYSGGFQVMLGDVLPDAAGDGNGVLELIVAGTNKVAVYELTVPERGAAPEIAATPAAEWAIGPRFRITGLAAGDFSAAASDEVVVATAAPAGTVVRTFSVVAGSFAAQSTFQARSYVEGGPQRRLRDVFANGASLAVGDIDGAADGKPELVLAAATGGLANFRVLANALVTGGTQPAIDTALAVGNGFTRQSRSQYATVGGKPVWQPAGGPDYFVGTVVQRTNAQVSVAVVNATGRSAAGQVFAALGPQNATRNEVRRLFWRNLTSNWDSAGGFAVVPSDKNRFPLGGGLLLG